MNTTIPDDIGNLILLERLELRLFEIFGKIPDSISQLSRLRVLEISSPLRYLDLQLTGDLLPLIANTTTLESIFLFGLELTQEPVRLHANWPSLTSLTFQKVGSFFQPILIWLLENTTRIEKIDLLDCTYCRFDLAGDRFSHLKYLDLTHTQSSLYLNAYTWPRVTSLEFFAAPSAVSGTLNANIGLLKNLRYLDLSQSSYLTGTIPESLGENCRKIEKINFEQTSFFKPFPESIGNLGDSLEYLSITQSNTGTGTIPRSWTENLKKLKTFNLSSNDLSGSIPNGLYEMKDLENIQLDTNKLVGSVPMVAGKNLKIFDLHNNRLTGSIPDILFEKTEIIDLSFNLLGPDIDPWLFSQASLISKLDLSNNHFSSKLPEIPFSIDPNAFVSMTSNFFSGTIPNSFCNLRNIRLSHNRLIGDIDDFLECPIPEVIQVDDNELDGTLTSLGAGSGLRELKISNNRFSGVIPLLPEKLKVLEASSNRLNIGNFLSWAQSARNGALELLDLSSNDLAPGNSYQLLISPHLKYLFLANNSFDSTFALANPIQYKDPMPLLGLDLSRNKFTGQFSAHQLPALVSLTLSYNQFSGGSSFILSLPPSLTQLDLSENRFSFDVATLPSLPLLSTLNLRNNLLYGSLTLNGFPNLQYADFSGNLLRQTPDFASIGSSFSRYALQSLNISNMEVMPTIDEFDTEHTGLNRSSASAPSVKYRETVKCYSLSFYGKQGRTFLFDEDLFNYRQCDCNEKYFGFPPNNCYVCPSRGISQCEGSSMKVSPNYFAIDMSTSKTRKGTENEKNSISISSESQSGDIAGFSLETESCAIGIIQTLTGVTNCRGLNLTADELHKTHLQFQQLLASQCIKGSEGRLCSKCTCDIRGRDVCYYEKASSCEKCKRTFRLSETVALALSLLIAVIIVLSFIMFLILRSKRTFTPKIYAQLPIYKKVFYRVIHLTSLGQVSILITFLQLLVEFTRWDAYASVQFVRLINGNFEAGLGLVCLFPFLADPLASLFVQLSVPFAAVALILLCIGISELLSIAWDKFRAKQKAAEFFSAEDDSYDAFSSANASFIDLSGQKKIYVHYPALALLTSVSITAVRFFYFGTAITAHKYLFWSSQPHTGIKYVQSSPWMLYSDAYRLIGASIPAILIFDFFIPAAFAYICWRYRSKFDTPEVQIYFGSLFMSYRRKCYWWEIVNTIRKLSIALVLQAFSSSNAIQSALVVTILAGVHLVQASLSPWKRKSENFSDLVSTVILIGALLSTRPGQLTHTVDIIYYIAALATVFVLGSIGVIFFQTFTEQTDYEKRLESHFAKMKTMGVDNTINDGMNSESAGDEEGDGSFLKNTLVARSDSKEPLIPRKSMPIVEDSD